MTYLEELKSLREDNDLSQKQIAEYIGIAQTTYSQYERGVRVLPLEVFAKLCRYYHVSADKLLGLPVEKGE